MRYVPELRPPLFPPRPREPAFAGFFLDAAFFVAIILLDKSS